MFESVERMMPEYLLSEEDSILYLRHLAAYDFAGSMLSKNSLVLEIGCGEGYGTSILSRRASKIIGLDTDRKIIAHASKKYGTENCIFRVYDGARIPYEDNTFDAVMLFQTIEHVRDDMNCISEAHRVLNNGGLLMLTTPNRDGRLRKGQKPWNAFHFREYSPVDLKNMLESKFSDVRLSGIYGSSKIEGMEAERIKKYSAIASLIPFGLYRMITKPLISAISRISRIYLRGKASPGKHHMHEYKAGDHYLIKEGTEGSMDILALCRK